MGQMLNILVQIQRTIENNVFKLRSVFYRTPCIIGRNFIGPSTTIIIIIIIKVMYKRKRNIYLSL